MKLVNPGHGESAQPDEVYQSAETLTEDSATVSEEES